VLTAVLGLVDVLLIKRKLAAMRQEQYETLAEALVQLPLKESVLEHLEDEIARVMRDVRAAMKLPGEVIGAQVTALEQLREELSSTTDELAEKVAAKRSR